MVKPISSPPEKSGRNKSSAPDHRYAMPTASEPMPNSVYYPESALASRTTMMGVQQSWRKWPGWAESRTTGLE
jgi:hypothetical protein